jgi:hypothetical protein
MKKAKNNLVTDLLQNHVKLDEIEELYMIIELEVPKSLYPYHMPLQMQYFLVKVKFMGHKNQYAIRIELDVDCLDSMEPLTIAN